MPHTQPVRVRVGVFEVDLGAGELRALDGGGSAARILLPQQALQVLTMLLERSGQLVSREEIQKKLWPNDTVVEFEHSINAAIAKLRKAFGDSANEPSYIETIAKRGYRLIARTKWLTDSSESSFAGVVSSGNGSAVRMQLESAGLAGRVVSHYRVLDIVGGGGMGVVYRAEDLKLGRQVALKFLPEEIGGDARALDRFEWEARAASSLDHPNICSIHEFGEHEGHSFIVMQLLEGETLRERLSSAALHLPGGEGSGGQAFALDELLHIASQIADGLQAAHERGIIHRDIKPANIFLTKRGLVKILDFGVAKLVETLEAPDVSLADEEGFVSGHDPSTGSAQAFSYDDAAPLSNSGGLQATDNHLTRTGLAMGTVGYMSPEQVRGEKVDARTDIFSFGVVLYEMATGQRAFSGETVTASHDAILNQTPAPAHELNPAIPPKLEQIINRAIKKDRELRYQMAGEIAADLRSVLVQPTDAQEIGIHKHSRWKWLGVAAVIAVVAILAGLYGRSRAVPKLTQQDTIVLADFDNYTHDPVFDDTLKQALAAQLSQSPFFNVLSNRKVQGVLKEVNRSPNEPLIEDLAREVCQHAGSKAMLAGSIGSLGKEYMLGLRATDCNSGRVLAEAQERTPNKETVLKALDEAAVSIRKQMGEPLISVQKYAMPPDEASTSSLEAWKTYAMGLKTEYKQGGTAALAFFKRTVEIDPDFTTGYYALSTVYSNLNEGELSEENARRAYELRDKVGERLRLVIEATYYDDVTGELEKEARSYELVQQNYPRDFATYVNLGVLYARLGQHEKFLEATRQAMRLDPNNADVYLDLEAAYANLNRLNEAEEVLKQARQHNVATEGMLQNGYVLAFLKGDTAQMRKLAVAIGTPGTEDQMLATQADTEGWYGRLKSARKLTRGAMESAQRNDAKETAAGYQVAAALREVASGNLRQGHAYASEALNMSQARDMKAMGALALALSGDVAAAEKLADELDKLRPLDTLVQRYWLPTIRAAVALERKDATLAVELLKGMETIELANAVNVNVLLCPVYVRGEAYLMLRDGKAASAEFQKFLNHYGLVSNFSWGALARLGLARAYALEATNDPAAREKARTAYKNFLTLWNNADPDIPIYKQAKAEYERLQ